ncbi:MAG: hypothetical protein AB8G96_10405 [Phycisphaerales bacterium]
MFTRLGRLATPAALALMLAAPLTLTNAADAQNRRGNGDQAERGQRGGNGAQGQRGQRGQRGGQAGGQNGRQNGGWGGWGGGGNMFSSLARPGWERRDLEVIDRRLDLDADQEAVVEILLFDYLDAFEAASEAMREEMQAARPEMQIDDETRDRMDSFRDEMRTMRSEMSELTGDRGRGRGRGGDNNNDAEGGGMDEATQARLEAMRATMQERMTAIRAEWQAMMPTDEERAEAALTTAALLDEWMRERALMAEALAEQMQVIMTEEQIAEFPSVLQEIYRLRSMRSGRLSGESVDLGQIAQSPDVALGEAAEALTPMLAEYHTELDVALRARDQHMEKQAIGFMDAMRSRNVDLALDLSRTEAKVRSAVRDTNLRYVEFATLTLAEAGADSDAVNRFRSEWSRRAFEAIHRDTIADRTFAAIMEFEDLDPDVREAVEQLQFAYAAERADYNLRMEQETVAVDAIQIVDRIERMAERFAQFANGGGRGRGGGETEQRERVDQRLRDLREERGEMDLRYRALLVEMMTPEQVAELPLTREQEREARQRDLIERFDTDGDGELSREERTAANRDRFQRGRDNGGDANGRGGNAGGRGGNAGGRGGRGGGGGGGGN